MLFRSASVTSHLWTCMTFHGETCHSTTTLNYSMITNSRLFMLLLSHQLKSEYRNSDHCVQISTVIYIYTYLVLKAYTRCLRLMSSKSSRPLLWGPTRLLTDRYGESTKEQSMSDGEDTFSWTLTYSTRARGRSVLCS